MKKKRGKERAIKKPNRKNGEKEIKNAKRVNKKKKTNIKRQQKRRNRRSRF
jgi:hypothetical protein